MTISLASSRLSKPKGPDDETPVPKWMLEYVCSRSQQEMHSLVLAEFRKSGITQATLRKRLGRERADVICRNLRAPGNWTASTLAIMLFAISGSIPSYAAADPAREYAIKGVVTLTDEPPIKTSPSDRERFGQTLTNPVGKAMAEAA